LDKVKLIDTGNQFGVKNLVIEGLEEGTYSLTLRKEDAQISIRVVKGELWKVSPDFILTKRALIEKAAQSKQRVPRIDKVQIEGAGDEGSKVSIQASEECTLHAFAFQFHPRNLQEMARLTDRVGGYQQEFFFGELAWKNFYLSNRALSDENRYIMERKYQEKNIGNSLDTPTMLLKRNFIRDTSFSQEQLAQGTNYEKQTAKMPPAPAGGPPQARMMAMNDAPMMMKKKMAASSQREGIPRIPTDIQGFQNFLSHACEVKGNLKAKEGSPAEFKAKLAPYSSLYVIAVTDSSVSSVLLSLDNGLIPQRDMSLSNRKCLKS